MKESIKLSVVVCSYNPNEIYINKALRALQTQTAPYDSWEIILIDNKSDSELSTLFDISWHPNSTHHRENRAGQIYARIAGSKIACGQLILFLDDDNLLAENFIEEAIRISEEYPNVGAFGGVLDGVFETEPPEWFQPYYGYIAVRPLERTVISNLYVWDTTPSGAGMVVSREIALRYCEAIESNPSLSFLGRKGEGTGSADDVELAYTALDMGYSCGRFTSLSLKHLIPASRLTEDYIARLIVGLRSTSAVLAHIRGIRKIEPVENNLIKDFFSGIRRKLFLSKREYRFFEASVHAKIAAGEILENIEHQNELSS